jgi:hypothetical protein
LLPDRGAAPAHFVCAVVRSVVRSHGVVWWWHTLRTQVVVACTPDALGKRHGVTAVDKKVRSLVSAAQGNVIGPVAHWIEILVCLAPCMPAPPAAPCPACCFPPCPTVPAASLCTASRLGCQGGCALDSTPQPPGAGLFTCACVTAPSHASRSSWGHEYSSRSCLCLSMASSHLDGWC